jgi:hypothetical protein
VQKPHAAPHVQLVDAVAYTAALDTALAAECPQDEASRIARILRRASTRFLDQHQRQAAQSGARRRTHRRASRRKARPLSFDDVWKRKTVNDVKRAIVIINHFTALDATPKGQASFYSKLVRILASHSSGRQAMVERILETDPPARSHIPPFLSFPVFAVEMIALALVVEHIAVNGLDEWARLTLAALHGHHGPLPPPVRPFGAPKWYAANSEWMQTVAGMLADAAPAALASIRRCALPSCLGGRHRCTSAAPYFAARRTDKAYCCVRHGTKGRERRAQVRADRGAVSPAPSTL